MRWRKQKLYLWGTNKKRWNLLKLHHERKLNIISEKRSVAATVLTYTEKELAAIKALEANKGERLSSAELGISGITLVGLRKKAEKVEKGVLANPEGLPVLHIVKDKVEREFKEVKSCTVYGIK